MRPQLSLCLGRLDEGDRLGRRLARGLLHDRRLGRGLRHGGRIRLPAQTLGMQETITGGNEGLRGLGFSEAMHAHAAFPQTCRQAREITVRGHQTESLHIARIQKVHGIDDQGGICRVLALGITELLDRLNAMVQKWLLPGHQIGGGPVPIGALDAGVSQFRDLRQQFLTDGCLGIVCINQYRKSIFSRW